VRFDFTVARAGARLVKVFALAGVLVAGLHVESAHAGRPMVTDDAGLVEARSCQVEAWAQVYRRSTEYWVQPACNLGGNLEITLGGALGHEAGRTRTGAVVLQGKTLFKPLQTNGWGIGLAAGTVRHPQAGADARDWYAYVPASFSLHDDAVVVHVNLGWLRTGPIRSDRLTWGLGTELGLSARTWLIAEIFGEDRDRPFQQFGLRHELVPGRVQVDAAYGGRSGAGGDERWFSLGLVWVAPPFLP
jgi:hypothetical protein